MSAASGRRFKKPERRSQILLELKLKPHVRIAELASQFDVTTETIRRDLDALSEEGRLSRDHGGASAPHPGARRNLDERRIRRIKERQKIGQIAASMVAEGDTIMIDAGSTTMEFARSLAHAGTRVLAITNSLQIAMILGQSSAARVLLAPGYYLPQEAAVVGNETVEFLSRYNADACFLGASGLSLSGVTEAVEGFDHIKRSMLQRSRRVRFLMDATKVGQTHSVTVAQPGEFDTLITDRVPPREIANTLRRGAVEIVTT